MTNSVIDGLDPAIFFPYTFPMQENSMPENKMGVMPVGRLLVNMSLPMMISMFVLSLYNIVDSIFVSQISEEALAAVSMAFPFQMLMVSFGLGTAVGVNALLSMRLGQKNQEAVNASAMNGIFLAAATYIFFAILCLIFVPPYFRSQTQNQTIISDGITYLNICMLFGFGMFGQMMFDRLLQATGRTIWTMTTQLIGAIFNIIFDPILIFGLGPFPKMGIAGAAAATVAGQILAGIVSMVFNIKVNKDVHFSLKGFRPDLSVILQIYKVGAPSIVLQAVGSLTSYTMNLILGMFKGIADTAIAVYGVYFKLNSFVFMPVFGLNSGLVPIVAYNYGAKKTDRIKRAIKLAIIAACLIMSVGVCLFEFFPKELFALFNASDQMLEIGIPALRTIAPSFMGAAVCICLGSVFQALGSASYSMFVSIARQLLFLLPSAYLLSLTGKINNVWWSFLIAEMISIALSLFFFARVKKKKIG